jgi:hypothetical protein
MAIDTRPPVNPLTSTPTSSETPIRRAGYWGLRGAVIGLTAFIALTAIQGAIFVLPAMPRAALQQGVLALFPDYTIPALALGVLCGGAALLALVLVIWRPQVGALAAMLAGAFMVAFELVEIVVVGFTPAQSPDQWPAWLQVVYLAVGGALVILGARLWKAETGSYALRWPSL